MTADTIARDLQDTSAAGRPGRLGPGAKLAYGAGQLVDAVANTLLNTYLFFYLTNVCGLSGSLTGIATFIALAIDAFADPLIGSISDNLKTRWGRRVPVMAVSVVPIAILLGLLFSIPRIPPGVGLFAYALALMVALRVAMSGYIIPYLGLGAEVSTDYDERSSVAAFRAIIGIGGILLAYALGFGYFLNGPQGLLDRAAYAPIGWIGGGLLLLFGLTTIYASHRHPPAIEAEPLEHRTLSHIIVEVRDVFRNPSFRWLFGGVLLFFVGYGVYQSLALDGNKYYWDLSGNGIQSVVLSMVAGLILGLPLSFVLIGRVEKRTVVLVGITTVCLAWSVPPLLNLAGLLPAGASVHLAVLVGAGVLAGMAITPVTISFQSAMADAIDEHELLFGGRREGLYFASLSFAQKAALGLGSLIAGILLDFIRFPSAAIAAGTEVTIAPEVVRGLGWVSAPVAALITLTSVALLSRYRLDRAAHAAILAKLNR